ncbi:hypothetical protein [Methylobacterium hispanicum]|nr:hypothetical protein [Methylobacterium hispanicum]
MAGAFALLPGDRRDADGTVLRSGGSFFRFEAAYIVKRTGAPLTFDVVVPCQQTLKAYVTKGGSVTAADSATAPYPWLAVAETKDGAALAVDVPRSCGTELSTRAAGERLVPSATWYDSVGDLASAAGAARAVDYAAPSSEVEFLSASVVTASFSDYAGQIRRQLAAGSVQGAGTPFGFSEAQVAAGMPPKARRLEARAQ